MGASQSKTEGFKQFLEDRQLKSIYPSPNAQRIKAPSRKPTRPALQSVQTIELQVLPIKRKNESTTNAFDGRTQVLETAKWPNSVHGLLISQIGNIKTWGTGILIGSHVVLTAGHNLYNYETRAFTDAKSLQFLPGMNGQVLPFGLVGVEKYFVSPNYIKYGKEDFGIVILKQPIGEMTGYFGLACLEPEEIKGKRINITGYPSDKVASKPKMYEMWEMGGIASHIDKEKGEINYVIDTGAGQSGSGVWYQEGEDYYVCGVHVTGTNFVNTATLLTRKMYQQIYAWIHQDGLKESFLKLRKKTLEFSDREINAECVSLLMKYDLNDIRVLNLVWNSIGDEGAKALAQNTSWINLSELYLDKNNIRDEGAKALAKNTTWLNLSKLRLSENNINAEGAKALAKNTTWVNLSQFDLSKNNIGAEGAKELAQNTSWVNLSQFYLFENNIRTEGAEELAQNTSWVNISLLSLYKNNIGAEGAEALAQNTSWASLSELYLYKNSIGTEGTKALAQNTSWINLSKMDLSENNIGYEGAKAIAQNISWMNLSILDFSTNNIGAHGAKILAQNPSWVNLSELYLYKNNIGIEGAKELARNIIWVNLLQFDLSDNNIGDEGAKALARNTSWINLSLLDLSINNIGAEGAKALAQNTSWANLSDFRLTSNNIGEQGAKALAQNISWINLSDLFLSENHIQAKDAIILKQNKTWKQPICVRL